MVMAMWIKIFKAAWLKWKVWRVKLSARITLSLLRVAARASPCHSLAQDGMMRPPVSRATLTCYSCFQSRSSSKPLLQSSRCLQKGNARGRKPSLSAWLVPAPSRRAASSRATLKLKDLPQGPIVAQERLPDIDDAPTYPAVVQGARNNMLKFENCVVLTRVGNFYEARLTRGLWRTCR